MYCTVYCTVILLEKDVKVIGLLFKETNLPASSTMYCTLWGALYNTLELTLYTILNFILYTSLVIVLYTIVDTNNKVVC